MTFIILSILAILAAIFSGHHWGKKVQIRFIIVVIGIGVILLIAPYGKTLLISIRSLLSSLSLQPTSPHVIQKPIWIDIAMFMAMILGMLTARFHDLISRGKSLRRFTIGSLLQPLFVSPIVFGSLYGLNINFNVTSTVVLILFSFQNGFFWSIILKKTDHETNNGTNS